MISRNGIHINSCKALTIMDWATQIIFMTFNVLLDLSTLWQFILHYPTILAQLVIWFGRIKHFAQCSMLKPPSNLWIFFHNSPIIGSCEQIDVFDLALGTMFSWHGKYDIFFILMFFVLVNFLLLKSTTL
jgi:hypothetical protein